MKYRLLEVVELLRDLPEYGLHAGSIGAIVEVYADDCYEVEFANERGETLALPVLSAQTDFKRHGS